MADLNKLLLLLETYKGRDKFLRLLCYSSKCAAGLIKYNDTALSLDRFSKQLSTSRACFRLLDDVPNIVDIIRTCADTKNKSSFDKHLLAIESVVDVIFGPLDHVSWAIDHKIINSSSSVWDTASTLCWVISLYINIYKIVMKLSNLSKQKLDICQSEDRELRNLSADLSHLKMSALKCLLDVFFAVNYLPKGILWAQSLDKWQVGALGTLSSLISLYQSLWM